jgi:predicted MPP superfamily phosphohydrolase
LTSLKQIFDLYNLFNGDVLHQLKFLALPLGIGLILLFVFSFAILGRKYGRQVLGRALFATNLSYLAFLLMLLSLPLTNTSYGLAQPVAITFGVIYLLILDFGLAVMLLSLNVKRLSPYWQKISLGYVAVQVLLFLVFFYSFYLEPGWVDVTQNEIRLAKLVPGTPPLKVALISDIHMERWTSRERTVVSQLEQLKPDLVFIAGDHINIDHYEPETYDQLKRFFTALSPNARYGTYAVAGLTERYDLGALLDGTGVKLLDDSFTTLQINGVEIYLTGIRSHRAEDDAPLLHSLTKQMPQNSIKFLLYHTPDLAPEAAQEGYDFYFAGHTHGGQIALPFYGALFAGSKYGRTYSAGLYYINGETKTRMYVTRGLGFEGFNAPRARLFARPELSVLTFLPANR